MISETNRHNQQDHICFLFCCFSPHSYYKFHEQMDAYIVQM